MAQVTRETTAPVAATRPVPSDGGSRWHALRWGSIFAGLIVAIATLVLLTTLGVAIGLTADPVLAGDLALGTAATVWGIVTAVIAFVAGGVVAGMTSVSGPGGGLLNGAMVGAFAVAAITLSAALGVGNLLGAGAANLGQLAEIAPAFETEEAVQFAQARADDAALGAWVTFFSLLAAIVLAGIGGLLGGRGGERPVTTGERRVVTEHRAADRESTV